jgi:hypothetical protein
MWRLKEKDVDAVLIGSDMPFPESWLFRGTQDPDGAILFVVDGQKDFYRVPPGMWAVRDRLTDRIFRMEHELFVWIAEAVEIN